MDKVFNTKGYSKEFSFSKIDEERISVLLNMVGEWKDVLDLGCGDGYTMELLKKKNNSVCGIEISEKLNYIAKKKGFKVYDLDLNSDWSKAIGGKFDVLFAGEIIEHIFDTDCFLQNVSNVMGYGSYIVLSTPNIASLPRRLFLLLGMSPHIETTARNYDAGHIRYFTYKKLKELLEDNGFIITKFTSDGVNISSSGNLYLKFLAKLFPTLGRSLIIKAEKCSTNF